MNIEKEVNIEQLVLLLTRIVRLIEEMQKSDDFLGKNDVIAHLRWSTEHVSREIWSRAIHKNYE